MQIRAMTLKINKGVKGTGWLLLTLFFLSSCTDQPLYEKVYSFKNKQWSQEVKPEYQVEITDIEQEYDFTLSLRVTTGYAYNNLWVFMKTETPDGTTAREPFEIIIANPDGSWVGNKTGTIIETPLYFKSRKLPQKGVYKFTIEQGITESKINEVLDLGFRVEKTKKD
jgi:gliding motility-associated lipoprotein GldH